jgi:transcriptional regulator with XRE-family HTH domain
MEKGFNAKAYVKRLRLLRRLLNMDQTQFAEFLGIDSKTWSHYERGFPVSRETAFLMNEKLDEFSLDWLYWGRTRGMTWGTLEQMNEIEYSEKTRRGSYRPLLPLPKVKRRIPKTDKPRR